MGITPRAAGLGDGAPLTPAYAELLKRFRAYKSNFGDKGQDEVHVKCQASQDRAIFRLVNGAWAFQGLAPASGQAPPTTVDAATVQFEFHALLLHRNEAEIREQVGKPHVIRRGQKNRESSVQPPAQRPATEPEPTAAVEAAAKAIDFAASRLPAQQDLVPFRASHPRFGDVNTFVSREEARSRLDLWFRLMQGSLPVTMAGAVLAPSDPIDVEAKPAPPPLEYRIVRKEELTLLVLALWAKAIAPGGRGNFHIVELVDAMAAGNVLGELHVPYNSDIYVRFRDHALAYIPRHVVGMVETQTGKVLDWELDDVKIGVDERGQTLTANVNHYFLRDQKAKV